MTTKKVIFALAATAIVAGGVYLLLPKSEQEEATRFITSPLTKETITQSITATGTIEPVTLVDIGTQVSGILTNLFVDYNSIVKKGQVIAELDKSTLLLDRNSNRNSVALAQSKLTYEEANYKRIKSLFDQGHIADSEYDLALYNYETAKNNLSIAKNTLARSETNLGYATIYSPIDGVVISKSVEEGQTVASSFSTPTLFTVAADLKDMRVIVDVDEADIGNVREGQRASFTVDAFPLDTFDGIVTQVRQEAIVESNVTTYEVVISAANPDLKLKPGLTANVEVFTLYADCEQVIYNSALAFTPPMPKDAPQKAMERKPMEENSATIWVLKGGIVTPRRVTTGVTNGIQTEIIGGGLSLRDSVVLGTESSAPISAMGKQSEQSENPFMPKRPGQNRQKR